MPENGYTFKPTPEIRSFAEQMLHLADVNYIFATVASDKPNLLGKTLANSHLNEKTMLQPRKPLQKW